MSESIKEIVSWLGIFGIPSIFVMSTCCIKACFNFRKQILILIESQQSQMRRDLLVDYKTYTDQGWVDEEDLKIWEDNYQKYHSLGKNGIMDKRRETLLNLPTSKPSSN